MGSIVCGTGGCPLELFRQSDVGYGLINTFPISRLPVVVSPQRTRGWHDLWERVPAEPTPQGTPLLSDDPGFSDGIPLAADPPSKEPG